VSRVIRKEYVAALSEKCSVCARPLGALVRVSYRSYAPTGDTPPETYVLGVIPLDEASCVDEDCAGYVDSARDLAQMRCERWTRDAAWPPEWDDYEAQRA